jgi:hypothetical protein
MFSGESGMESRGGFSPGVRSLFDLCFGFLDVVVLFDFFVSSAEWQSLPNVLVRVFFWFDFCDLADDLSVGPCSTFFSLPFFYFDSASIVSIESQLVSVRSLHLPWNVVQTMIRGQDLFSTFSFHGWGGYHF